MSDETFWRPNVSFNLVFNQACIARVNVEGVGEVSYYSVLILALIFFRYKASWCRQLGAVLWRSWITNNRDVIIFRIRLFQAIVSFEASRLNRYLISQVMFARVRRWYVAFLRPSPHASAYFESTTFSFRIRLPRIRRIRQRIRIFF